MARTTRRLGRGLDSLISDLTSKQEKTVPVPTKPTVTQPTKPPTGDASVTADSNPRGELPLTSIDPNPYQPRDTIHKEDILSLVASVKRNGILQPITVRPHGKRYQIVVGERRWRAAKEAGLERIPVTIRQAGDEEMLELALIENLEREDLNAIDRARAYRRFCDEFSLKADDVARRMGEDRSTVANYLRLLDLSDSIQGLVAAGTLSMGHARCLLGVADTSERTRLARAVTANDLSVRALEEIVRRHRSRSATEVSPMAEKPSAGSANIQDMQRRFEESLKTRVTIKEGKRKGTGRIIVQYFSLDDFDRIAETLGVPLD